jgi:glycosyltransferase involved in cell wall biosynthesis
VRAAVPDAILTVIGKSPPGELRRDSRPSNGIEVTGYVDDPTPYLAETAVFIVPLHAGGGMRVKILDAWIWGLPVVSTSVGAEGIDGLSGGDLLLVDSPDDFAAAVVKVMRRPELADRLSAAGRRKVEVRYNWRAEYKAWDDVYAPTLTDIAPSYLME